MSVYCVDAEPELVDEWVPEDQPRIDPAQYVQVIGADGRIRYVCAQEKQPVPSEPAEETPATEPAPPVLKLMPRKFSLPVEQKREDPQDSSAPAEKMPGLYDLNNLSVEEHGTMARFHLSHFIAGITPSILASCRTVTTSLLLMLQIMELHYESESAERKRKTRSRKKQAAKDHPVLKLV